MRTPASDPIDDHLRELLAVERRLQARVAQARDDAERRVRDAHTENTRQLAEADAALAEACAADARDDALGHERERAAIQAAHEAALARLTHFTSDDVDRLSERILRRLLRELGGTP
jgi:vacuolar-type H+-ATPase subunit H